MEAEFLPQRRVWERHVMQFREFKHQYRAQISYVCLDSNYWDINAAGLLRAKSQRDINSVCTCASKEILIVYRTQGNVVPRAWSQIGEPGFKCASMNKAPAPPEQDAMKREKVSLCSSGNLKLVAPSRSGAVACVAGRP